jgi:hypothetical protein
MGPNPGSSHYHERQHLEEEKNDFLIGLNGIQQNVFESELILDFSKRIIKDDFKIFYENIVISRDIETFFLVQGPM